MRDKMECTKAKLYIEALNDECVAIVCAVAKFDDMLYIKDAKSKELIAKDEIQNIIRRYLRMEPEGADEGLIELVTSVVKKLLSREQGIHEDHHYHVVYSNKGFIRFDYFIRLEILTGGEATSEETTDGVQKTDAVLSYYGQVGLMNVANAKPQVLLYELRRATKDKDLKEAGEELQKLQKISSVKDVGEFLAGLTKNNDNHDPQPSSEPKNPGNGSG